jgi:hypothetical protein
VYRHFGMTLPDASATAIENYVAAKPNGGYGEHHYRFEDHGLDEQRERAKFRPYMVHFGVTAETTVQQPGTRLPERAPSDGERSVRA